jgi:hypothetical protein
MNAISLVLLFFSWESIYNSPESPVFADSLFRSRQYYEALTEYKRYVFEYGNSKNLDSVYFQIALSYRYTGEVSNSNKYLDLSLANSNSQEKISQIFLEKAINQIITQDFYSASMLLTDVSKYAPSPWILSQASYYLLVIDVLKSDYTSAKRRFLDDKMWVESKDSLNENYLGIIALLDSAANTRFKDVNKAILLSSFLPGLGQIYCKACVKEVLNSFLLNGALVALITISIIMSMRLCLPIFYNYFIPEVETIQKIYAIIIIEILTRLLRR